MGENIPHFHVTPNTDTCNIWALITFSPYVTSKLFAYLVPFLFSRLSIARLLIGLVASPLCTMFVQTMRLSIMIHVCVSAL